MRLPDFYERLCEAFQTYTPFDPETPKNQQMINSAFVAQSYADIQWKLQKLEGFSGMNVTQPLEVAKKSLWTETMKPTKKQIKKNETESTPASSSIEELRSNETDCSLMERGN